MRLIIIDDQNDIISILSEIFASKGYEIVGTANEMDLAKKIIKEIPADVILLDISLTENGNEGVEILAECREHTTADIFIVTNIMMPSIPEICYALGAFFYISKSIIINTPDIVSILLQNRTPQDALNRRYVSLEKTQIINNLTNREIEALKLKEKGFTYTQIGKEMYLETDSAKRTVARARSKIKNSSIGKFIKKFFIF